MPAIRTTRSHRKRKRPSIGHMFVSVTRVKPYTGNKWNFQLRLSLCGENSYENPKHLALSSLSFHTFESCIKTDPTDLKVDDGTWSIVWRMSDSEQLDRVYDDHSFQSAGEDHTRAYKSIVQLYIIKSKG
jgi:hypothetical protein